MKDKAPKRVGIYFEVGILLSAVVFTLFLFFIDEGRYTLSDILDDSGNLLAFGIYASVLLLLQWLVGKALPKNVVGAKKLGYTLLVCLGLFFVLLIALWLLGK